MRFDSRTPSKSSRQKTYWLGNRSRGLLPKKRIFSAAYYVGDLDQLAHGCGNDWSGARNNPFGPALNGWSDSSGLQYLRLSPMSSYEIGSLTPLRPSWVESCLAAWVDLRRSPFACEKQMSAIRSVRRHRLIQGFSVRRVALDPRDGRTLPKGLTVRAYALIWSL